jgi:DNA-directed RNA polymerase specialized sigma24 family protein
MNTALDGLDWTLIWKTLDAFPPKPDAYHFEPRAGSTLYRLQWLDFSAPPANQDAATRWSTYDALCSLSAWPWDKYSAETILLGHARLIQKVVMEKLKGAGLLQRERFAVTFADGAYKKADLGGEEVFQQTLLVVHDELRHLPDFTVDESQLRGPDDGPGLTDLLALHIRAVAQRAADRFLKRLLRERKRSASLDWEKMPEPFHIQTPEKILEQRRLTARAVQAVKGLTGDEAERQIIEMKELRLSDAEIGRRLGWRTHTVNRTWHRLLDRLEERLGLLPGKVVERAKRKPN